MYQWSILWAFKVNIKENYELDVSAGSFWYNRQLFFGSSFLSQRSKRHNNDNAIINARSDTVSLRCIFCVVSLYRVPLVPTVKH